MDESDQHPLSDEFGLPANGHAQESESGDFLPCGLGVVAVDHVAGEDAQGLKVTACMVILESADPDVAAGHPGEDRTGQRAFAENLFSRGGHCEGPGGRNAECGHCFAHDVFPDGGAEGRPAIPVAGENGWTGSLQLDVAAHAVGPDHLAEENGPAVPELGDPSPELVSGVGEGYGIGPLREGIAGKHVGRKVPGGEPDFLREGVVEAQEGRGAHRGRRDP